MILINPYYQRKINFAQVNSSTDNVKVSLQKNM